jgi:hypothetical protein
MKEINAPPLLDAPLLHIACSLQEMEAKTPWIYSPCKLKVTRASSSSSQGFLSNPHQVRPPLLEKCALSSSPKLTSEE